MFDSLVTHTPPGFSISSTLLKPTAIDLNRRDEAGGNIAAAISLRLAVETAFPTLKAQILIHPPLQAFDFLTPSMLYHDKSVPFIVNRKMITQNWLNYYQGNTKNIEEFLINNHTAPLLKTEVSQSISVHHLPERYQKQHTSKTSMDFGDENISYDFEPVLLNPYFCPLLAQNFQKIPMVYIVSVEFDVLRDDSFLFAQRLRQSGARVFHDHFEEAFHGVLMFEHFYVKEKIVTSLVNFIKDQTLDTYRRLKLAKIMMYLMRENDLDRIKKCLGSYTIKERQEIVSTKLCGSTMLFNAANTGKIEQVRYLIQECNVDVDQRGKYGRIKCTPLWIAIQKNHLSIVIMLVDYGADINTFANGGRSALSISCFNIKIANLLLRRGADVNLLDGHDRSCLMYSVCHLDMCCLLLSYGANINETDVSNRSSLHYAVKIGSLKVVELLVGNGADLHLKDIHGNTPLLLSALKCRLSIIEYLIHTKAYSPESIACAYELLGSRFMIERHNFRRAVNFWLKALNLRQTNSGGILKKKMHPDHINAMGILGIEFESCNDLMQMSQNIKELWTQALLIQFRILGHVHPTTINSFILKSYDFINRQDVSLGVNLLSCIFYFFQYYNNPFKEVIFSVIETFTSLFKIRNKKTRDVHVFHLLSFLRCIIHHIISRVTIIPPNPNFGGNQNKFAYIERYLVETLRFIDFIMDFDLTSSQMLDLKKLLYSLISQRLQETGRISLLHLSVRVTSSTRLISILIECGENIDAIDDKGNTAIHYVMEHHDFFQTTLLKCLINRGCHLDMVNKEGHSTLEYLQHLLPYPVQHTRLQCLAARVIKRNSIPYQHYVPTHLEEFISCHG